MTHVQEVRRFFTFVGETSDQSKKVGEEYQRHRALQGGLFQISIAFLLANYRTY